ncbi:hypothetical protein KC326_g48 [Hortaea werneckii]|nr:hypothetical protein KC326_g48 [Hortaea werneckii]
MTVVGVAYSVAATDRLVRNCCWIASLKAEFWVYLDRVEHEYPWIQESLSIPREMGLAGENRPVSHSQAVGSSVTAAMFFVFILFCLALSGDDSASDGSTENPEASDFKGERSSLPGLSA